MVNKNIENKNSINENKNNINNKLLFSTTILIVATSLIFFGLGYFMHQNTTTTQIVYKTNYIKPGNATIIAYYYPSIGYTLYNIAIKGENLSIVLNYNSYTQTQAPNSIIVPETSTNNMNTNQSINIQNINISKEVINSNTIPALPSIRYAAAFTQLKPFSKYNITLRYVFRPPCTSGICPEISSSYIMMGSESKIIETGANNSIIYVYFSNGPGIIPNK